VWRESGQCVLQLVILCLSFCPFQSCVVRFFGCELMLVFGYDWPSAIVVCLVYIMSTLLWNTYNRSCCCCSIHQGSPWCCTVGEGVL
jgi:hypothetical protein